MITQCADINHKANYVHSKFWQHYRLAFWDHSTFTTLTIGNKADKNWFSMPTEVNVISFKLTHTAYQFPWQRNSKISRSAFRCALIIAVAGQTNSQGKCRSKRWMWSVPAANAYRGRAYRTGESPTNIHIKRIVYANTKIYIRKEASWSKFKWSKFTNKILDSLFVEYNA